MFSQDWDSLRGTIICKWSKCKTSHLRTTQSPTCCKLRVCIDPQDLNRWLQLAQYPMPTIEDILPDLSEAKCFSVLDAKDGFWHVRLEYESSLMTKFNSSFGRFRWLSMPFWINTASPAPSTGGVTGCQKHTWWHTCDKKRKDTGRSPRKSWQKLYAAHGKM